MPGADEPLLIAVSRQSSMTTDLVVRRTSMIHNHLFSTESRLGSEILIGQPTAAREESCWSNIPQAPPDAILGITEAFKQDKSKDKINLGVGAYRTEEGKPLVLEVVKKAQQALVNDPSRNLEYLPIGGIPEFCQLSAELAFGSQSSVIKEKRNVTVQSLSGTGSLRIGAEFLKKHFPGQKVIYVPRPTWANHEKIFPFAGIEVRHYRYWNSKTCGLDFQGMIEDLQNAPDSSIVLLHACAHNPTGVDPTPQQWSGILRLVQSKHLLPFFDSAYQGFASGDLERDAEPFRSFADAGLELILAQSFAKNMGLYGERIGALTIVTSNPQNSKKVESQLKAIIRPFYSSPPRTGAEIVVKILSDARLYADWKVELKGMADRIKSMRSELHKSLQEEKAPGNWDHIVNQIGMFSYTGLNKAQVKHLTDRSHIYLTQDGRISMAGLNRQGCKYLAKANSQAIKET